ncbi:MAG: GlsB/YeaQ/YmgE family stress response membrane protein [Wenzhouxiangellaceae bacterium]|nr:GlsB/YeaQ/YmgE family stress response membrane protein [Wenzhouxiangellaceae bacterium]MBS3747074.1 GlsB/YeaQ/YmgE family stress response membrane protein [Wenzhouxiangellaceae bacterium]MBS3823480.1 GlsB/YeaQ/YmgE family stress response membrane protein [Wenzhouxiangellaceae bacterium]
MTVESILGVLIIGGLAGWIAGLMVRGKGHGIVMNIVVGIVGAYIGAQIFAFFDITAGGTIGSLIVAIVGAAILLGLLQLIRRA